MTSLDLSINDKKRLVVCAAARHKNGFIIPSPRHYDSVFHAIRKTQSFDSQEGWLTAEQGFIDQWGVFMDRVEAKKVAQAANQIKFIVGNEDSDELYSENLY